MLFNNTQRLKLEFLSGFAQQKTKKLSKQAQRDSVFLHLLRLKKYWIYIITRVVATTVELRSLTTT